MSCEQNELCLSSHRWQVWTPFVSSSQSESSITSRAGLPPDPVSTPRPTIDPSTDQSFISQGPHHRNPRPNTVHLHVHPGPGACLFKLGHAFTSTNNTECVPRARPCARWWAFGAIDSSQEAISSLLQSAVGPADGGPLCSLGQPPGTDRHW